MIYKTGYQGIAQDWLLTPLGITPNHDYGTFFWGNTEEIKSYKRDLAGDFCRSGVPAISNSLRNQFKQSIRTIFRCKRINPLLDNFRDVILSDPKFFDQLAWDVFTRILLPNPQKIDIFLLTLDDMPICGKSIPRELQHVAYMTPDEIDQIKVSGCLQDKLTAIDERISGLNNAMLRTHLARLVLVAHVFQ
jgi:hypothetical protein